jgi:Major Facilitator Superfamily
MYVTLRDRPTAARPRTPGVAHRVAGIVVLLGIVSMLTDISSESVNAVLPIYLTSILGMSTLAYGFIDGIYQGVSALVRIVGGWISDRADHPKWVAVVGYLASAISRFFLLPATTFAAITSIITVDRLGKGLRTAPRDALIAASSPSAGLGRAFGVHRALDTLGALIGPLIAFAIIGLAVPNDYHVVFVASLAFAIIGVAVLILIVPDLRPRRQQGRPSDNSSAPTQSIRPSWRHLRNPSSPAWSSPPRRSAYSRLATVSSTSNSPNATRWPPSTFPCSMSERTSHTSLWRSRSDASRTASGGHRFFSAGRSCCSSGICAGRPSWRTSYFNRVPGLSRRVLRSN